MQSSTRFPQQTIGRRSHRRRGKKQSFSLKCLFINIYITYSIYYIRSGFTIRYYKSAGKKNNGIVNETMTQTCSHLGVLTSHCVRKSRERNRIKSVLFINNIVLGPRAVRYKILCTPICNRYTYLLHYDTAVNACISHNNNNNIVYVGTLRTLSFTI